MPLFSTTATVRRRISLINRSLFWTCKRTRSSNIPIPASVTNRTRATFIGLAFSSNGKHLYASVGSLTDPTGAKPGNTGNAIAVYTFAGGKVAPERLIPVPLQPLTTGKKLAVGLKAPSHMAIPYPAGMAVISDQGHDKLLIANNLSDNVVILDPATKKVLQTFDLSSRNLVPSEFPYT